MGDVEGAIIAGGSTSSSSRAIIENMQVLFNKRMCSTLWLGKFVVGILKNSFERFPILSIYSLTYSLNLRSFLKKSFR